MISPSRIRSPEMTVTDMGTLWSGSSRRWAVTTISSRYDWKSGLSFESVSPSCADAAKEIDAAVTKSNFSKNDAGWVIFVDSAQLQGAILAYFSAILATGAFCRLPVTSLCSSQTRLHLVKINGLSLRSRSALPTMISEWLNYRAQRRIEKLSQNPAGGSGTEHAGKTGADCSISPAVGVSLPHGLVGGFHIPGKLWTVAQIRGLQTPSQTVAQIGSVTRITRKF